MKNIANEDQSPELLKELQAMPLEAKIALTQVRLDEFYCGYEGNIGYGNGYISFSGGKDSTVLLDIARKRYPEIRACFSDTGLEYPEIRQFAMSHENIDVVRPKMRFDEVISTYGYPLIGKEVAEAIYYARRISPEWARCRSTHTSGRTTEHHRGELHGKRHGRERSFKEEEPG